MYFVHDHHNGTFHIHALDMPGLTLTDITEVTEPIAKVSVGTTPGAALAWRIGACSGLTRSQISNGTAVADQPAVFAAQSTEPVGWLDPQQWRYRCEQPAAQARATCGSGTSPLRQRRPLVAGVDNAAIRSVLTSFGELPNDINNAAPG